MNQQYLHQMIDEMRQVHIQEGSPSANLRIDRLERAKKLLLENRDQFLAAISADFGHRNAFQGLAADILTSVALLDDAKQQLSEWMKSEVVNNPFEGMKTEIQYQPLGVVGIISPWNFPLNLAFGPLAGVFAAGNRAVIKPSELTPKTSELLAQLVPQYFNANELRVVTGDADIGAAFSALAFDHLIFTGSTNVGKHVMRAAAENLVPVTLELGGKSPVVLTEHFDLKTAVERILTVKTFNAGQICISPDYVMMPEVFNSAFIEHAQNFMKEIYDAHFFANDDFTSIISEKHFARLQHLLDDAKAKGATLVTLGQEPQISDQTTRKIVPTLVFDVSDDMLIMQEEIFGPLLPIRNIHSVDEGIDYINAHPRPLAAYYFDNRADQQQYFAEKTISGGLVINDVMTHVSIDTLPFGGVGASGMGAYHGIHGFRRFSHAKAVVIQSKNGESNQRLRAPYAEKFAATQAMLNQS
ncbi:coniferyl aldehyde dehydrogenase [Acinetobacter oleivorans]|uniref:coniferyl aldehyde dehydrogenase n=1 Tax=Acinetobacter oleivorans TaxID=1148157 RepID=UPI001CD73E92|nr:coniferyl aldehyde dehydrogenase [Acinetobacter oleivorans]